MGSNYKLVGNFEASSELLGQKSPWTIVPRTNVSLDKRPLYNCRHTRRRGLIFAPPPRVVNYVGGWGNGVTTKRLTSKKAPGKKAPSIKAPGKKAPGKKAPLYRKGSWSAFFVVWPGEPPHGDLSPPSQIFLFPPYANYCPPPTKIFSGALRTFNTSFITFQAFKAHPNDSCVYR